jgi:hypothetical protein
MRTRATTALTVAWMLLMGVLVMGSSQARAQQVPVSIPDVEVQPGDTANVPVEVGDLTGEGVTSYDFRVQYDSQVLEVTGAAPGAVTGEDASNFVDDTSADGEVSVAFAGTEALSGAGTLVYLQVRGVSGGSSALSFSQFQFNEGNPSAQLDDGAATVADVFVSLPDTIEQTGNQIQIPVETSDLTGEDVISYDFDVSFDTGVVDITGVDAQGTLSEGLNVQFGSSGGVASVAVATGQAIEGRGELIRLEADVVGSGTSGLTFDSFQFNEGTPAAATTDGSLQAGETIVSLPDVRLPTGQTRVVEISTSDLTGLGATSYEFEFSFDPAVVQVSNTVITEGTQSEGTSPQIQVGDGTVTVAAASASEFEGTDPLVGLEFEAVEAGSSPLRFTSFQFNEGSPVATTVDGQAETFDNDPPQFTAVPEDTSTAVNEELAVTIDAEDPNGDEVEFSLTEAPEGAAIDSASGDFAWTPDQTQADSTFEIGVRASDGLASSDTSFAVTVTNDPPQFTSVPGDTSATVNEELAVTVGAEDPEGEEVEFSLTEAPEGAAIDSTSGDFAWTPTQSQANSTFDIGVQASDGTAASDTSFAVTVEERPQARAQLIHNAADPAAETVDVYFGDSLAVDDFAFRSATPFIDVPAEVEIDVGIAPGSSSSVADTLASFPVTFAEGQAHTVVANGVLSPGDFADNPDGQDISLTLFADAQARESAASPDSVDVRAVHGATDAPTVDIDAGGTTLFDDVTYGDLSGYLSVAPASVRLEVTPGGSDDVVAAFQADLSGLDGQAATMLASGFLDPSTNQDGPAFGLVAVLADGTVVEFPTAEPQQIGVDITRDFGDASNPANYELVALPGDVDVDLAETVSGEQGPNWRAFRELGATNDGDAGLQEYDGSDAFNFREGRAFWVISQNPLSFQDTVSTTNVSAVDLQGGWNAVSNPLRSDLDWQSIRNANGLDEALWRWDGGWSQVDTLESAQTGEGYYVFNSADIDSLSLSGGASGNALAAKTSDPQTIDLTARTDGEDGSGVTVGIGSETSTYHAPPAHFASSKTTLRVLGADSDAEYARMVKPVDGESTTFSLMLRGPENETARIEASGLDAGGPEGAVLVNESSDRTYDLQETSTVSTPTGDDGQVRLSLHVGAADEIRQIAAPEKTQLQGNYPNPFSQQTTVELALSEQADVKVQVYNVLGQQVATVADGQMEAGNHELEWNGSSLSSGVYFVRMEAGDVTDTHKITVVR